jgi:hypothetical protein
MGATALLRSNQLLSRLALPFVLLRSCDEAHPRDFLPFLNGTHLPRLRYTKQRCDDVLDTG